MTSTNTVDLTIWQDKFAAINSRAEAMWDEHQARLTALASELEGLRAEFADAMWGNEDDSEDGEIADNQIEIDARMAVYQRVGYLPADITIGCDHQGNPY